MKKFIKQILIFALIFFIIDKAAYFILVKTSELQSDKKLEKILEGGMDKELIILGSSRGIGNLIGEQLENETGLTTYNLSYRGSDINFQSYIFKSYLLHNSVPQNLFLVIDNPALLDAEPVLSFRYDRLYPLAHYNEINDTLIKLKKHSIASRYIYCLRLQSSQLRFNKIKPVNNWIIDDYGSQILYGKSLYITNTSSKPTDDYTVEEDVEKINSLNQIQELCQEKNIKIHYIFPPNLSSFNKGFLNRFLQLVPDDVSLFIYDDNKSIYKDEKYFYDESHLNHKGAELFTKDVSDFINNKKELF